MGSGLTISTFDLVIIVLYLIGIMVVGIWVGYRKKTSSEQFFLAGKSLRWPVIGAALFTANISTIHLVGLAADGFRIGIVVGNFEWMASVTLIILGLVFAPFYFRSKISTLPEYLEKRYSSEARMIMAFIAILGALFIHIGISLYAGAQVMEHFFGINMYVSITVIALILDGRLNSLYLQVEGKPFPKAIGLEVLGGSEGLVLGQGIYMLGRRPDATADKCPAKQLLIEPLRAFRRAKT